VQYILLIYHDERAWDDLGEEEQRRVYAEYRELIGQLQGGGQYLAGSQLKPTTAATCVRVRDGKRLVTDGPFAETREQLGGYFLIEAANLDEAVAVAARIPSARMGTIEVRPLEPSGA
jgi:hypothetical protein